MSGYIRKHLNPKLQTPFPLREHVMQFTNSNAYGLTELLMVLIEHSTPETKNAVLECLGIVEVEGGFK
jgi:hypothetical protein